MTITPSGEINVKSNFKYIGEPMLAREIGLRFSVPRECDHLTWDRDGEWNHYPDDSISRLQGSAVSFAIFSSRV